MKKQINDVADFHKAFDCYTQTSPNANIPAAERELRQRILQEEFDELNIAAKNNDIVEIADALGDIIYVALGTVIAYGLTDKFEAIFAEIQRSNMSKLDENGKPILRADGKILKSKQYSPPQLEEIINGN